MDPSLSASDLSPPVAATSGLVQFFGICLGGALGTGARHAVSVFCLQTFGPLFPYGTFAVNSIGSLLLGMIMQVAYTTELLSPTWRLILGTGVMGGFTTYSTFNYETLRLIQEKSWALGLLNIAVTVVGCLLSAIVGIAVARRFITGS